MQSVETTPIPSSPPQRKRVNVKENKKEYFQDYYRKHKAIINKNNASNYRKHKLGAIVGAGNVDVERFGEHANTCSNFLRLLSFMRSNFPDELKTILEQS